MIYSKRKINAKALQRQLPYQEVHSSLLFSKKNKTLVLPRKKVALFASWRKSLFCNEVSAGIMKILKQSIYNTYEIDYHGHNSNDQAQFDSIARTITSSGYDHCVSVGRLASLAVKYSAAWDSEREESKRSFCATGRPDMVGVVDSLSRNGGCFVGGAELGCSSIFPAVQLWSKYGVVGSKKRVLVLCSADSENTFFRYSVEQIRSFLESRQVSVDLFPIDVAENQSVLFSQIAQKVSGYDAVMVASGIQIAPYILSSLQELCNEKDKFFINELCSETLPEGVTIGMRYNLHGLGEEIGRQIIHSVENKELSRRKPVTFVGGGEIVVDAVRAERQGMKIPDKLLQDAEDGIIRVPVGQSSFLPYEDVHS